MKRNLVLAFSLLISHQVFAADFTLESPAFTNNAMIPAEYTCDGTGKSPALSWQNIPANTQSLALVVDDPDAESGNWTHWVVFNIPTSVTELDTGGPIPEGAATGLNSWGGEGYRGPCPPTGAHRYVFTLYALDTVLVVDKGASKDVVLQAMTSHVIGKAVLTGLYQK